VYDQEQLCAAGLNPGATISKIAWFKNGVGSKDGITHSFKIYMKNSDIIGRNGDTWTNLINGATKVFDSDALSIPNVDGWWELNLDAPFIYTGKTIEIYTDWFVGGGPNGDRTNGLISFGQTTLSGGIDAIRRAGGSAKFSPFTDDEFVGGGLFTNNVTPNLVNVKFTALGGTPRTEICGNGIDDDCNGQIDEGCPTHYASVTTGNWNVAGTWQRFISSTVGWLNAIEPPKVTDFTIQVLNTHIVTVNTVVNTDQLTINAGGRLRLTSTGSLTLSNGTGDDLTNKGTLELQAGSVLQGAGGNLVNEASVTVNAATFVPPVLNKSTGSISFNGNSFCAAMTNDGNIFWQSGNLTADPSTEFVNNATGVFNISSDNSYGQGQINNKGTFKKTSTGTTTFNGSVTSTGTIMGVGTYNFSSGLNNSGVIAPGNSIGTLTVNSSNNPLSTSSNLLIEVENASGAGIGNDLLVRNGNLTLQGKLTIVELGAAVPAGSYEIIRLTSGTLSGNFSQTQIPDGYTVEVQSNKVVVTRSNAVTTFPGSGNGLRFDGVNSLAGVNNNAAFNFTLNQNFTVECWVRIPVENQTDAAFNNNVIIEKWGSPWGAFPFGIWYYNHNAGANAGRVAFVRDNGAGLYGFVSNITINDGKYHHIAVQKDGTALRMFVDGISMGSVTDRTTGETSNTAPLLLGSSQDLSSTLKGELDEVRIWNTAISQDLIRTWMCKKIKTDHPAYPSLVVLYTCDQSTASTTLFDNKGSFNSSLLNNAVLGLSGAPIGDASAFNYGALPSASLSRASGEKLTATSAPSTLTGIHVYVVESAPNTTNGITGVGGNNRYFGVHPVGSANPLYTGVYDYSGNPFVTDEAGLRLFKRNSNDITAWSTVAATQNTSARTLTFTGNFTEYMLGSIGGPLPLNILSFTGSRQNSDALLQWRTADNRDVSKYEVQRSADGANFITVGSVAATGTQYSFTDRDAFATPGTRFYRIKSTGNDGRLSHSAIIKLMQTAGGTLTAFPNPAKDVITLAGLRQNGILRVYNTAGSIVHQQQISTQTLTLDISRFANGLYQLQYVSNQDIMTLKIMKQ
jgi:hypothetical protein